MQVTDQQDIRRLWDLATTYRTLVLVVGAQFAIWLFGGAVSAALPANVGSGLVSLSAVAVFVLLVMKGYHLAKVLGRSVPVLWAIAMIIPLVNLICLLVLSSAAQRVCAAHGVGVGLLGPRESDIQRLERAANGATRS